VLRLPQKKKDEAGAEADHIADGRDRGDAGDPVREAEDVPPDQEADDLDHPGRGRDTVLLKLSAPGQGQGINGEAEVERGQEVRAGLEKAAAIHDPDEAADLGLGSETIKKKRSQRKIKTGIKIGTRTELRIRIIKRMGYG